MASAQQKFWKLTIDSRLLALEECQQLHADFSQVTDAPPDDVAALGQWLVSQGILSRYQVRVLLSGRAGPFWLGEYKILDRHDDGQIKGLYQALCRSTGNRVLLFVVPRAAGQDPAKLQALARKVQKAATTATDRLVAVRSFAEQGSLAYAVLAEFLPPPVVEPAPPPNLPEQPAEEWAGEILIPPPRSRRRNMRAALVGWGAVLVLLLAGGGSVWLVMGHEGGADGNSQQGGPPSVATNDPAPSDASPSGTGGAESAALDQQVAFGVGPVADSAKPPVELIADDGQTLWASPTAGPPLNLGHLPAGAQAILVFRPAELLGNVEGAKMLEAIGPASATAATEIQSITLCQWSEIEQLQIALYPVDAGPVRAAFAMRLAPSVTTEAWTARLKDRTSASHAGKEYFQSAGRAYYLPASEAGRLVVIASPAEIKELIDADSPRLTKEMERLLADTDAERHFTLLGEPFSVFNGGQTIFVGELERLAQPLRRFLGAGVQAALISGHVEHDLFLELRAYGQADKDPRELAAHYQSELAALPQQFEAYLATLQPQPYGQAVLSRFPKMLDQLQQYTRSAAEHHQAVLRCYLPAIAGHNLLMGTELALAEVPKSAGKEGKEKGKKSVDVAAALAQRVSLSFPSETFEKAAELLSTEIGVEIVILGSDLQPEGITKNQRMTLDEREQPGGEILLKMLKMANSDGKLVYVIKPRAAGGAPIIFISTRAAVKKRGDPLPPAFEKN